MIKQKGQAHSIRCRCGIVRGELSMTRAANHGVCYCRDCRTYAFLLSKTGDFLDSLGGTEVIATLPQNVSFIAGVDQIACLSLSPRGALRWYANCCGTPLANTPRDFRLPYVGLIRVCLEDPSTPFEDVFGPVRMRVNTSSVKGRVSTAPVSTFLAILKFFSWLLPARINGNYRHTPFFDAAGSPLKPARVISLDERNRAMRAALDAQSSRAAR